MFKGCFFKSCKIWSRGESIYIMHRQQLVKSNLWTSLSSQVPEGAGKPDKQARPTSVTMVWLLVMGPTSPKKLESLGELRKLQRDILYTEKGILSGNV